MILYDYMPSQMHLNTGSLLMAQSEYILGGHLGFGSHLGFILSGFTYEII
jgi:hypothetical protein